MAQASKNGPNPQEYMLKEVYIGYDGSALEEANKWVPAIMFTNHDTERLGEMMVPRGKMSGMMMEVMEFQGATDRLEPIAKVRGDTRMVLGWFASQMIKPRGGFVALAVRTMQRLFRKS